MGDWLGLIALVSGFVTAATLDMLRSRQRHRHRMEELRLEGENQRLAERTRASIRNGDAPPET